MDSGNSAAKKFALRFVLIIGVVQLFADMTYEGARGIIGPFLGSLGASAAVVGFTAGFGELMGYGFRSVTGYFADKTHKYWVFIFAATSSICWPCPRWPWRATGRWRRR